MGWEVARVVLVLCISVSFCPRVRCSHITNCTQTIHKNAHSKSLLPFSQGHTVWHLRLVFFFCKCVLQRRYLCETFLFPSPDFNPACRKTWLVPTCPVNIQDRHHSKISESQYFLPPWCPLERDFRFFTRKSFSLPSSPFSASPSSNEWHRSQAFPHQPNQRLSPSFARGVFLSRFFFKSPFSFLQWGSFSQGERKNEMEGKHSLIRKRGGGRKGEKKR